MVFEGTLVMNSGKSKTPAGSDTKSAQECPVCYSNSIETYTQTDSFKYGSGESAAELSVELPVRHCDSCGFEYIDREGERAQHNAVCKHLGILTPGEIVDVRKMYGMTRAEFARVTGLGEATLGRWESGSVLQNKANDRYLRLLRDPAAMGKVRLMSELDPAHEIEPSELSQRFPSLASLDTKTLMLRKKYFELVR